MGSETLKAQARRKPVRVLHRSLRDADGDGVVNVDDQMALTGNLGRFGVGDLDRDGESAWDDLMIMFGDWGPATASGVLSFPAEDNIIGYCGYIFADETHDYLARNRHYNTTLGRWIERDPAGYVDGMSLYEYVAGMVISRSDPSGLGGPDVVGGLSKAGEVIAGSIEELGRDALSVLTTPGSCYGYPAGDRIDPDDCRVRRRYHHIVSEHQIDTYIDEMLRLNVMLHLKYDGCNVIMARVETEPTDYMQGFWGSATVVGAPLGREDPPLCQHD